MNEIVNYSLELWARRPNMLLIQWMFAHVNHRSQKEGDVPAYGGGGAGVNVAPGTRTGAGPTTPTGKVILPAGG